MEDRSGLTNISTKNTRLLFSAYTLYIIISVIAHFIIAASDTYFANDRMMGIFKNPNQMGFFLVAYYLIYIFKIRSSAGSRWDYLLPAILLFPLILTGSRSALFAMLMIHIAHFILIRKWSYLTAIALLVFPLIAATTYKLGKDDIIQIISRRDPDAVRADGNMRFKILTDTIEESTHKQILLGKNVSIGTNGMIYEQKKSHQQVKWLDNLINILFYNWGIVGLMFLSFILLTEAHRNLPVVRAQILITIFFLVSACFFLLSDFFPLAFTLVFLKNDTVK